MVASLRVVCPQCDQEFLVAHKLEQLGIKSQCPFCEHQFFLSEANRVIRGQSILLIK